MFQINRGEFSQKEQGKSRTDHPPNKRAASTLSTDLNHAQSLSNTDNNKKSRLVKPPQNDQSRLPGTHKNSIHSEQLALTASSSPQHKPVAPRIAVHYIPLSENTAQDTDAKRMAETFSDLSGRDVHLRGSHALSGATEISFHGHGDLANNTLSYLVRDNATWSAEATIEGHTIEDLNEDHRIVVVTPNELLRAMESDGFVPSEFSGAIRSYSCQGTVFLKNFMESTWPDGKADVVGVASDWNIIMHPNTSAQEIMYLMKNGGEDVTIVHPGEDFMIEFPDGLFQQTGEWAGRYDDANEEYVFRPKMFTEVKFSFSGNALQQESIGEKLLNNTKMRSISSTRP